MTLELSVLEIDDELPGVRTVVLGRPDGGELPAFAAGSHVFLACGYLASGERHNAYSLTGLGEAPRTYRVSVLRTPGNGGSAWLHTSLHCGDRIMVSEPRSGFAPVANARHSLYLAAGIGITPLLSHVHDALRWGRAFEIAYLTRTANAPHLRELERLCGRRLTHLQGRAAGQAYLAAAIDNQPVGTYLYACGPRSLLDDVRASTGAAGWPRERVRLESFTTAVPEPGAEFEVRLNQSGRQLTVAAGTTLLAALRQAGVAINSLCEQGVCGECRTPVLSGELEHRDFVLSERERRAGRDVLCCVSRASGTLVLDK